MDFLTLEETAKYFRVHKRTVSRWIENGSLKGYKLGKGRTAVLRISKTEIDNFLKKNKK